jgi:hypothetical protein
MQIEEHEVNRHIFSFVKKTSLYSQSVNPPPPSAQTPTYANVI